MKWILVTGGAKNLGASICLSLAEKGYSIAVHYNKSHKESLDIVDLCRKKGGQAEVIQGDFSSLEGVSSFIKRYQEQFVETEALINNVGNYLIKPSLETTIEEWNLIFQLNLHLPFMLSQALSRSLIKNQGQIVNIGVSGLLKHSANSYSTAYYLAKEGLWGLTRSLAKELASRNVRVNMVSPGELEKSLDTHKIPMNRPAYCWEVCRVINFLLDPASAYITGQNIEIAGGLGLT